MTEDSEDKKEFPRYYKWVNGFLRYNADGTRTWLTEWPDPEYPDSTNIKIFNLV
jgi:hypothetical protein